MTASWPIAVPSRTQTIQERCERWDQLVNSTRAVRAEIEALDDAAVRRSTAAQLDRLRNEAHRLAGQHLPTLLDDLSDLGLSWRDIAAVAGVSVPALRKWRKGGAATPDNRIRVGFVVALAEWVRRDRMIGDVGSWLEIPIDPHAPVSRLDLLIGGHEELVIESLIGSETAGSELLDRFDSTWRETYASDFEVFDAADGQRSIRRRG